MSKITETPVGNPGNSVTKIGSVIEFQVKNALAVGPKRGKYRKLQKNAYKSKLLKSLARQVKHLSEGVESDTRLVRFDENTQKYHLHFGIGRRCVRFENDVVPVDSVPEFDTADEAILGLTYLMRLTKEGEFDEVLDKKRTARQKHAAKMTQAKTQNSFVSPEAKAA